MEAVAEEIPEPLAFDQSRTVNGVVVTVKADPGVFPADAVLSVETVPVYQQQQADAAVDEVRGENQNVAVSYTFDIKVINPETGEEYQPAEGQTVSVSFALAEVADENLETQVYHVTEDEATGELTAESLDVTFSEETVDKAVEEQIQVLTAQLARQGLSLEMYCSFMNVDEAALRADARTTAEATLRNQAAIEKIVELENLEVDQNDVARALAVVCRQNNMTMEQLKPYCDDEFQRAINRSVLTSKVMSLIRENADIAE